MFPLPAEEEVSEEEYIFVSIIAISNIIHRIKVATKSNKKIKIANKITIKELIREKQ